MRAGDCHAEQTRVFRTIMKGRFGGQTTLLFVFSVGGGKRKEGYKIGSWCSLEKFCGRAADGKLGYAGGAGRSGWSEPRNCVVSLEFVLVRKMRFEMDRKRRCNRRGVHRACCPTATIGLIAFTRNATPHAGVITVVVVLVKSRNRRLPALYPAACAK